MTLDARPGWHRERPHAGWPGGIHVTADGGPTLRGVPLTTLADAWGTPTWLVDEASVVADLDEVLRLRGARPLLGSGPLALLAGTWAAERGFDCWSGAAGPRGRPFTDLRGLGARAVLDHVELLGLGRCVVDPHALHPDLLRRAPRDSVFLAVDGLSPEELDRVLGDAGIGAEQSRFAGLALRLDPADRPGEVRDRVAAALAVVSRRCRTVSALVLDGGTHPRPLSALRALLGRPETIGEPALDAVVTQVLADVTGWLLRRSSLALVRVDTVGADRDGHPLVGLSGPAPTTTARTVLLARPTGATSRPTVLAWPDGRSRAVPAPDDLRPGDVLALPGVTAADGLCVVVAPSGAARSFPAPRPRLAG